MITTYSESLRIDATLDHEDADGQGAAVKMAVLRRGGGSARARQGTHLGERILTRMVEISCRMSTACCAAACLSASGILAVEDGVVDAAKWEMC